MNYWLVVGAVKNWDTAFEHGNIWGLRKSQQHLWDTLAEGDRVLFYATQPVGGVIGHGLVRTKFRQIKPLWPEELRKHEVIWPLRFEFDVEACLPRNEWKDNRIVSKEIWPRAGFQLISKDIAEKFLNVFGVTTYAIVRNDLFSIKESTAEYGQVKEKEYVIPSHIGLQEKLMKIGELQNYIVEKEYPFDIGKLDVVWRRVINSVPTYVFEVQIGGDIYHALSKLKHAYDLWNSHIFIVATEKDYDKANVLLSGTFHEIEQRVKFIELNKVEELYERKKAYFTLEKELGI
jgi:predicted RNA-binding protein